MGSCCTVAFHPVRTVTWHLARGNPSHLSLVIRNDRISSPFCSSRLMMTFIVLPLCYATCVCKKIPVCSLKWQRQLRRDHPVKNLPVWLRGTNIAPGTVYKSQLHSWSEAAFSLWSNKVHRGETSSFPCKFEAQILQRYFALWGITELCCSEDCL